MSDYRDFLIPADSPRLTEARGLDPWTYAKPIRATARAQELIELWQGLYREPFRGITTDGTVRPGLFPIADEGFDVRPAVAAARALLDVLPGTARVRYPIDAPEWRDWYNPEWPMNDHGLRLDQASPEARDAVTALLRACFSDDGYVKTTHVRDANLFLGELYDLRTILNEWSYHFLLFGEPSETGPWGWNLYGHHLALNVLVLGPQIVVSPVFLGAEPNAVEGRYELFRREALTAIELMRGLPSAAQEQARRTTERWHFADERQLGGAYRDNRIIPYEGVRARSLTGAQQSGLRDVVASFLDLLPRRPFEARMRQVEAALDDTWFSWIGPADGVSPFYYRVQSPVIMVEFDNHTGVWLTNTEPARFHVHTIVRTPNGNDYGKDLLRQHYSSSHREPA
ncbi:DUF3500 domain-containing protein [Actinoplanes sp. RD1]|uniref:DUF3500 domain-containing protein n=1 Tax=Actinoplanes sp. RD1 TaxID=3064538 RepID=UPI002740D4D7|nr:DUF3500 domain-containing protein [Actinoplanes sp. RD1]